MKTLFKCLIVVGGFALFSCSRDIAAAGGRDTGMYTGGGPPSGTFHDYGPGMFNDLSTENIDMENDDEEITTPRDESLEIRDYNDYEDFKL